MAVFLKLRILMVWTKVLPALPPTPPSPRQQAPACSLVEVAGVDSAPPVGQAVLKGKKRGRHEIKIHGPDYTLVHTFQLGGR